MSKPRLTKEAWINAGLSALKEHGPDALKAEALARRLGTTKGSFYWHFKDIPAYHDALLDVWLASSVDDFSATLNAAETAPLQLRQIAKAPDGDTVLSEPQTEAALRAWAQGNHTVTNVIAEADERRTQMITDLLRQLGVTDGDFAAVLFAARIGLQMQDHPRQSEAIEKLVDLILALR